MNFRVNSLFGVPAGPLLNSRWVKTYADLGYDILTYKTVRTINKACWPPPNIIFIDPKQSYDYDIDKPLYCSDESVIPYNKISITNSFGVPSKEPDVWQEDVKRLMPQLKNGQLLILSIMGSLNEDDTEKDYINDFIKCSLLAKETGVKAIEVNLSCPNLGIGAIFNNSNLSEKILKAIYKACPGLTILAKIGYFKNINQLNEFVLHTNKFISAYVAINTVSKKILHFNGHQALPGKARITSGICGNIISKAGLNIVKELNSIRKRKN